MMSSAIGQPSSSASQPMDQQANASAPQPTQSQDAAPAPQQSVTNASAPSPTSPGNVSASRPTPQQQNFGDDEQLKSPTEVLVSRLPHTNGVTWIFHDPATSYVRHVNVPNTPPMAQQQPNQRSAQVNHGNEMVLYQPPSNQGTQHVAQTASAAQPMATPSPQLASVALPIASLAAQSTSSTGQQIY